MAPKSKNVESLCWSCKNFAGGCSWSKNFEPVKGWTAKPGFQTGVSDKSFLVLKCPEFSDEELTVDDIRDDGVENLIDAILKRAALDYINKLNNANRSLFADEGLRDIERWAESEHAEFLSSIDLSNVLAVIKERHHEFEIAASNAWNLKPGCYTLHDIHNEEIQFKCPFCGGTAIIKKLYGYKAARCSCGCEYYRGDNRPVHDKA